MKFLISTSYRTTGKSAIWKIDSESLKLELFREDQVSQPYRSVKNASSHYSKMMFNPKTRPKDYLYFGMGIYDDKLYCVGGNTLSILDLEGKPLKRKDIAFLRDAHDLHIVDGEVYCTNTGHDAIEIFSTELEHKKTIRLKGASCLHQKTLLPQKNVGDTDSLHANFLSFQNGEIFVTHFFTCEQNRIQAILLSFRFLAGAMGWQPFQHKGLVLNLLSGKILNAGGVMTLQGNQVISPLYGPHDGIFYKDEFYIHSTHNIETQIYDTNFELKQKIRYNIGMFLRGLHPIDQNRVLVGASHVDPRRTAAFIYKLVLRGRNNVQFDGASSLKIVDKNTRTIVKSVYFDTFQGVHPEIYKIIPFPR